MATKIYIYYRGSEIGLSCSTSLVSCSNCSSRPLMEQPQGIRNMTPEQLLAYKIKKRMAVISRRHEQKERANDLQAYLARKLKEKLA